MDLQTALLVTVTRIETQAIFDVFEKATNKKRERKLIDGNAYYLLGTIGNTNLILVQAEMGTSIGSGSFVIKQAIKSLGPDYVVVVGLAYGVNQKRQKMGDILVSSTISLYDLQRTGRKNKVIPRSDRFSVSPKLLNIANSVIYDWNISKVHVGEILSGSKLIDNQEFSNELLNSMPEAIGGEMEGAGLYAAAYESKVDWILIRAICDWADGTKHDDAQPLASRNAALFVLAVIQVANNLPVDLSLGVSPARKASRGGSKNPPPNEPTNYDALESTPPEQPNYSTSSNIIKPYTVTEDALDKHVATDKPIQSIKQDRLDFKIYVNALHSFILSKYTTTPITISIDGMWGTGKSSLMSMLKGKLDPQRDGVRKFFEWWSLFLPRVKWCWRFLWSFLPKAYGKALIALVVRNDVDDDGVHLYVGDKVQSFKNHVARVIDGFSIAPESLNQPENENLNENVRWWAQVNANCEPMEPPYHYTVWLNAWKFDNQEEVWASLALATMEQIKQKHGLFWRLRFWWELTFSRFSFWSGLGQVIKQFLLPLVFAAVAAYYEVILGSFDVQLEAFKQYGSPLLWAGAAISGILSVSSIFKDPFQIPLDKVFDRPNYKDKVKFLSHFEKDFARIVRTATKNGFGWKRSKLVIFIDDLDRCEPPKSADIVEAVNLFLDAEGCVFVIGMDSESVAMSIEVKYKDLFERMKAENTGVVSLGRLFLDKIVQIPFSVPRPTPQQITSLVNDTLGAKVLSLSVNISIGSGSNSSSAGASGAPVVDAASGQVTGVHTPEQTDDIPLVAQPRVDPASYAKPEVRAAILKGTELLADNPRQVKTFINLFRLSIYIANERKILEEKIIAEQTSGLNLEKLAIWTACSVRWTGLVRHLYTETQTDSLCSFIHNVSEDLTPEFAWKTGNKNIPTEIKKKLDALRKSEKGSEAHWCHLPWEWWLLEPDFLKTIKSMQDLWRPTVAGETAWLKSLLTMTKPIA